MAPGIELSEKIKSGKIIVGSWMSIPHLMAAETLAQANFDFLLLDGEHSPAHPDLVGDLLTATDLHGCPVIYRVRSNRDDLIKGALDAGAAGVMVPMVNSADDAQRAAAVTKYPPAGTRGFGPWRASNYYLDVPNYMKSANSSNTVVLQIESASAVRNIAGIAGVPQADVLFVGPADLALSMNLPLGTQNEQMRDAFRTVVDASHKSGKMAGIDLTSLDLLPSYLELGFTFFTYGADTSYLIDGARAAQEDFRRKAAQ